MCELLSPVGDFECLKAAVQNGANSVYLGASSFSARARAKNFDIDELKKAIEYAKTRNVKVHLTLNTLIKNDEFEDAVNLAIQAYNAGIDAIIIQDIGLASYLLKKYPEIVLHASTQMTCHNLDGVKQLESFGFKRVVLSRELSISEIKYIREHTTCELEVFIHGALCISYSGQCLLSSMIGGRSGNRGLCAQPCRMYYSLLESTSENSYNAIDSGYLLSPKDNLGIEYLYELIKMGIDSFKIEGRLKSPLYVGAVTRIYRKYIDLVKNDTINEVIQKTLNLKNEETNLSDRETLLQVFNRGGMSNAHFSEDGNQNLIYKYAPNNIGIYLGVINNINSTKGYITLKSSTHLSIGDKIMIGSDLYNVSELMINGKNHKNTMSGNIITIGRVKGHFKIDDKVYKIEDVNITKSVSPTYLENKEFKKVPIDGYITISNGQNITFKITGKTGFYKGITYEYISNVKPDIAINAPTLKERILKQLSKTGNTPFTFENITIEYSGNCFVNMKDLNEIRRQCIDGFTNKMLTAYSHTISTENRYIDYTSAGNSEVMTSILLNELHLEDDYSKLTNNINRLYIPMKYFLNNNYTSTIDYLSKQYSVYVYMPNILRDTLLEKMDYKNILNYPIKGFVISNISQIETIKNISQKKYEFIGNYSLNVYNTESIYFLKLLGISVVALSPELNIKEIDESMTDSELIVYGKIPVMTNQYCYLGKTTKCQISCDRKCQNNKKYYISDKFGSKYRIIPDPMSTITTMYFDKNINIDVKKSPIKKLRFDFLDESVDEINKIIKTTP